MSWSLATLGDLCEVSTGQSAPQEADAFSDIGRPFIRAGSLDHLVSGGNEDALEKISEENAHRFRMRLFPAGTIVFAKSGMSATLGRVYRLRSPCYVVSHLAALIPGGQLDGDFLLRWLQANPPSRLIANDAYPSIKTSEISSVRFPVPEIAEQRRVATVLDKVDVIRKKQREAFRLADEFLRSVFLDIFGGLLSAPTDQWRSLGDCTDFIDYRGKTPEKSDDGIRLITAKNVRDGVINIEPAEFISEATYSWWMSRGYPQSGDVLFTTEAPLGNIAVLRTEEPVAIGQRLIAIRPREMLRSDYLSWALRQDVIQRDIFSRATGSTVKGIRSAELVQVRVPIPSYDNQLKFERIVASVNHQKEVMHASAVQGEQLFQALQQQEFQGQL